MELNQIIQSIPVLPERTWSYLETLGVSHRETVMANLLAFYFNPTERHGLNDLFIRALLNAPHFDLHRKVELKGSNYADFDFSQARTWVEESTTEFGEEIANEDSGKRIDIMIEAEEVVIAIEFKINHDLVNPLDEYVRHVESKFKDKKHQIFLVLTPNWKPPKKAAIGNQKFTQVMMRDLIDFVEKHKLDFTMTDDAVLNQQKLLLKDFLTTLKNSAIKQRMKNELVASIKSQKLKSSEVSHAYESLLTFKLDLDAKVKDFGLFMNAQLNKNSTWKYWADNEKMTAILYKRDQNKEYKIRLRPSGWSLEKWSYSPEEILGEPINIGEYDMAFSDLINILRNQKGAVSKWLIFS